MPEYKDFCANEIIKYASYRLKMRQFLFGSDPPQCFMTTFKTSVTAKAKCDTNS